MKKYHIWATEDNGEGIVTLLGAYEHLDEIEIFTGILNDKVKITITYEEERR